MASRATRRAVAALAAAALAATLLAPPASAHESIVRTSPAGTAKTSVRSVAVLFSGPIRSGTLRVFGPAGGKVSKGSGARDPRNVSRVRVGLKARLAPGRYTARVSWTAADGHTQRDEFSFRLQR